jgi:hypothetical protein
MDSKDRDESKIRRREETLARRVGQALDQMNPQGAGQCPDAEVVAAYAEQALGPAESSHWEGHFAACARCRNILRVLAASADTPLAEKEVARLGERISAVRAPLEITGKSAVRVRPGVADWRMRWLAPAVGVAAVLAVWFALRPPWRATDRGASETLVAQAPKEEAPLNLAPSRPDQLSRAAPQQDQKADTAPPPDRYSANTAPLNLPVEAPARGRADAGTALDSVPPSAGDEAISLQQKKKLSSLPDGREIQPPAIPPQPPPLPRAQASMEAPAAPQSEAKAELDTTTEEAPQLKAKAGVLGGRPSRDKQAATVQGEAGATTGGAAAQKVSPELRSNPRNDRAFAVARPLQDYNHLVQAPSGSTLWLLRNGVMIGRSTDAGRTWTPQANPFEEDWIAGAAISDTVCWLVGRNGAIARTTDGEHWERVPAPVQAAGTDAKLPDWTGITTRDAQTATITASDGRHFATADGGKTWQLQ